MWTQLFLFLMTYLAGFVSLAFSRNWRFLLSAAGITTIFAAYVIWQIKGTESLHSPIGDVFLLFVCSGAFSGFIASTLIIIGQEDKLTFLRPLYVLPVMLVLGFGIFFILAIFAA